MVSSTAGFKRIFLKENSADGRSQGSTLRQEIQVFSSVQSSLCDLGQVTYMIFLKMQKHVSQDGLQEPGFEFIPNITSELLWQDIRLLYAPDLLGFVALLKKLPIREIE